MATWFDVTLSEQDVRRHCGLAAFTQGDLLERRNSVLEAEMRRDVLTGTVKGRWRRLDTVTVTLDRNGVHSTCTCAWGDLCRHAAAMLLLRVRRPTALATAPAGAGVTAGDGDLEADSEDEWLDDGMEEDEDRVARDPEAVLGMWLQAQPLASLRAIGAERGIKAPAAKAAAVTALTTRLKERENIVAALETLSQESRLALDVIDLLGALGAPAMRQVQLSFARVAGRPENAPADAALGSLPRRALAPLVQTERGGIVYVRLPSVAACLGPVTAPLRPREVAGGTVPAPKLDVLEMMTLVVHAAREGTLHAPARTEGVAIESSEPTWREPKEMTSSPYAVRSPLPLQPLPGVRAAEFRDVARSAGWPAGACVFVAHVLLVLGVIHRAGTDDAAPYEVDPQRWTEILLMEPRERTVAIIMAGARVGITAELGRVLGGPSGLHLMIRPEVAPRWGTLPPLPDVVALRALLIRWVGRLPIPSDGGWYAVESALDLLWRLDWMVLGLYGGARRPWFFKTATEAELDLNRRPHWDVVMRPLLTVILTESLSALGLVETETGARGELLFRPTPGAAVVVRGAAPTDSRVWPWRAWLADDRILIGVPSGGGGDGYRLLLPLTRYHRATPEGLIWSVTPSSLSWALNAGLSLEAIIRDLDRWCHGLPDDVRAQLERWGESFGSVHLYDEVSLIEVDDDLLLRELTRTTTLDDAIVRTLSGQAVVVSSARVPDLVREMERLGHAPRVVEGT